MAVQSTFYIFFNDGTPAAYISENEWVKMSPGTISQEFPLGVIRIHEGTDSGQTYRVFDVRRVDHLEWHPGD